MDSKGTHSVSLHSGKASCSGQATSTLERGRREGQGRDVRHDPHGHSSHVPPPSQSHPAHLRPRRPTLARTTRFASFSLTGKGKAIRATYLKMVVDQTLPWTLEPGVNLLGKPHVAAHESQQRYYSLGPMVSYAH